MFHIPHTCSLSALELQERREAFARLPLLDERTENGATLLRYRDEPGVEATLRELIRREADCCPGLDFSLTVGEGDLTLRVGGG